MTARCPISPSAPFPNQFGRIVATLIILGSLALAGCDFVDSNAVMDEPQIDEARLMMMPPEPFQFHVTDISALVSSNKNFLETPKIIGPPDVVPNWFDLVGTWRVAGQGQVQGTTVTLTIDQRVRLETSCKTYEGPFSSEGQGQLTIPYLQLMQKTCGPMADDPMVWALMAATSYKIHKGVLCITGARGDLFFTPTG